MNSKMMRFWNVIYPVLMYFVVTNIIVFSIGVFFKTSNENYMLQHMIATAATFPVIYSYYSPRRFLPDFSAEGSFLYLKFLFIPVLGACAGIALNNLMALTPLIDISKTFNDVNKAFFGSTLMIEILATCILTPILEELLYRGVVYGRIKEWLGVTPAILLSALLFGLMHFNLVQFVYAGVLGVLLACIMERYSLLAAILAHSAANLMAVLRAETSLFHVMNLENPAIYLACTVGFVTISAVFIWALFFRKK